MRESRTGQTQRMSTSLLERVATALVLAYCVRGGDCFTGPRGDYISYPPYIRSTSYQVPGTRYRAGKSPDNMQGTTCRILRKKISSRPSRVPYPAGICVLHYCCNTNHKCNLWPKYPNLCSRETQSGCFISCWYLISRSRLVSRMPLYSMIIDCCNALINEYKHFREGKRTPGMTLHAHSTAVLL